MDIHTLYPENREYDSNNEDKNVVSEWSFQEMCKPYMRKTWKHPWKYKNGLEQMERYSIT